MTYTKEAAVVYVTIANTNQLKHRISLDISPYYTEHGGGVQAAISIYLFRFLYFDFYSRAGKSMLQCE